MAKEKGAKPSKESSTKKGARLTALLASDVIAKLRKDHGSTVLLRASDYKVQQIDRIPSGVFDFDYALGGGFPAGRVSVLYGPKSSAKTTLFLKAIANAQRMCSNCYSFVNPETGKCACKSYRDFVIAFLDVEGALDIPWAKALGVDTEQLMLDVPEYAEQALDIGEALLRTGEIDILCLDSIAFLTPRKEIESSTDKDLMGVQARKVNSGVRKFTAAVNGVAKDTGRRPTIFFTNQIRFKLGVMFGNPETQPGGQGPGFAASMEARVKPVGYKMDEDSGKPIWAELGFKIEKNKTCGAKMEGSYKLMVSDTETKKKGDVYDEPSMVTWGERYGLITRKGGYNCLGRNFRIKADLEEGLMKDPVFKWELRAALMEILLAL
jgi:recombination protein RecA